MKTKQIIYYTILILLLVLLMFQFSKHSLFLSILSQNLIEKFKTVIFSKKIISYDSCLDSAELYSFKEKKNLNMEILLKENAILLIVSKSNCSKCIRVRGLKKRLERYFRKYKNYSIYLITGKSNRGIITRWAKQENIGYKDVLIDSEYRFLKKIRLNRFPALLLVDTKERCFKNLNIR